MTPGFTPPSFTPPDFTAPGSRPPRPALLQVEGLHVSYGKAEVVHGASLAVGEGEFVVMLGRNGAGKSTILNAICGLVPSRGGRVVLGGEDLSRSSPRDRVRAGIVPVLEGHRVFTTLSVEDNLLLGTYARTPRGDRAKLPAIYDLFPELAERRHLQASRLSGGQQQILAVGQGVIAEPRLLILDEPSGGLSPVLVDRILAVGPHPGGGAQPVRVGDCGAVGGATGGESVAPCPLRLPLGNRACGGRGHAADPA